MANRNTSSFINKIAIEIIEKEVGRPIENIPKEQLLKTVENLRGADFNSRGVRNYVPKRIREKLTQLILEEKFNNFVREIRSQEIIKNSGKYQSNPSQVGMTNRTRTIYDIENDILSACQNGLKKTAIMYKCNLSHESLIRYLKNLLDLGLIEFYYIFYKHNINEIYKPTELGLDFIYVFQQLNKILNNQKADEPVKLDVISREISISKLYKNDRKKNIYGQYASILHQAIKPSRAWELRKVSVDNSSIHSYIGKLMESKLLRKIEQDLYKTTERGLNFFREYLNLALFNYLG